MISPYNILGSVILKIFFFYLFFLLIVLRIFWLLWLIWRFKLADFICFLTISFLLKLTDLLLYNEEEHFSLI